MKSDLIRIGSRRSRLARTQSDHVAAVIEASTGVRCEVVAIDTTGDKRRDVPLQAIGAKGLFTKELEEMLLDGRIDVAVHSLKDLPADLPEGLTLGAITRREDPRDALVSRDGLGLDALPRGARIATGSVRRAAQIAVLRPDLEIAPLRGNVTTRLAKLDQSTCDAIVLAGAGLRRLGLAERVTEYIDIARMVPAPGQGALGVECRADDERVGDVLARSVSDRRATLACRAERRLQRRLAGGCSAPVGIHVDLSDGCTATAFVGTPDGSRFLRESLDGTEAQAEQIADALADRLVAGGANDILESVRPTDP